MKKVNALVLGLAVLLTVGCGGNDPEPEPENQTQNSCQLTRQVGPHTTSDFIYNGAGKLIRVNNVRQDPTSNFHMGITYNAAGNIADVKYFDYKNMQDIMQQVFSYNSQNLPDTIYTIHNSQIGNFNTYEYNPAGQLTKWSSFGGLGMPATGYTDITYPSANQSKEMVYHRNAAGTMVLNATREQQYDNKKNPYIHLNSLFEPMVTQNNLLSATSIFHTQGTTLSYTYTYIYNAEGYPTQQTITYNQGSSQPAVSTFAYNCQ